MLNAINISYNYLTVLLYLNVIINSLDWFTAEHLPIITKEVLVFYATLTRQFGFHFSFSLPCLDSLFDNTFIKYDIKRILKR